MDTVLLEFSAANITSAITSAVSLVSPAVDMIADNLLLLTFLGGALIARGFRIFRSARRAVG